MNNIKQHFSATIYEWRNCEDEKELFFWYPEERVWRSRRECALTNAYIKHFGDSITYKLGRFCPVTEAEKDLIKQRLIAGLMLAMDYYDLSKLRMVARMLRYSSLQLLEPEFADAFIEQTKVRR